MTSLYDNWEDYLSDNNNQSFEENETFDETNDSFDENESERNIDEEEEEINELVNDVKKNADGNTELKYSYDKWIQADDY